jgi:predicted nucleic acid-binding protein
VAFVLDASIAVAWVVPSQATYYARRLRLRAQREPYHVPVIFATEVTNVLVTLERRGILSSRAAEAAADVLGRLDPIVHEMNLSVAELRRLANLHSISPYDALYLALALEQRIPVACADRPLKAALSRAGVKLA